MFTDEEIHTIHSTCAPGSTADRLCHAAFQVAEKRDHYRERLRKYEDPDPPAEAPHRMTLWEHLREWWVTR